MKVFAIKDAKAEAFLSPFVSRTPGEAERSVRNETNHKDSVLASHPEDFALYELAEFNELTGVVVGYETPKHVVNVAELVDPSE